MEKIVNGALYVVSTPIGNLADITFRAVHILKNVDIIAAEDTRTTSILLKHYQIHKKSVAYHSYNQKSQTPKLIDQLKTGKSIALVSDAGTPGISDPAYQLVIACINENLRIIPIPGPSALLAALVVSGLPVNRFVFEGFLPIKKGRQTKQLFEMEKIEATHIIYESPYRILKLIENINKIFPKKILCIGKELTKYNEKDLNFDAYLRYKKLMSDQRNTRILPI